MSSERLRRRGFDAALQIVRDRMNRDGRAATEDELAGLQAAHADEWVKRVARSEPPPRSWDEYEAELLVAADERHARLRRGPAPDPIPRATLELAVRLLERGETKRAVAIKTGLSRKPKVDRIAELVSAGRLTWTEQDRLGLPPGTRATRDGVILPSD